MESEKMITSMKGGGSTTIGYDPLVQKIGMLTINVIINKVVMTSNTLVENKESTGVRSPK